MKANLKLLTAAGLRRMTNAGADAILPKPCDRAGLEKLVLRFLSQPPGPNKK